MAVLWFLLMGTYQRHRFTVLCAGNAFFTDQANLLRAVPGHKDLI